MIVANEFFWRIISVFAGAVIAVEALIENGNRVSFTPTLQSSSLAVVTTTV